MACRGRNLRSRRPKALAATAAAALALATAASAAGSTPALAATEQKGGCIAYLSLAPGGVVNLGSPEPEQIFTVTWAGSSSGWSPPGSLRITATASENGMPIGSVTGNREGTSVATPVGGPVPAVSADAIFRVAVTAYGPAGKVTCSTEKPVAEDGPAYVEEESGGETNGQAQSSRGSRPTITGLSNPGIWATALNGVSPLGVAGNLAP
jgi:hypothetical protein